MSERAQKKVKCPVLGLLALVGIACSAPASSGTASGGTPDGGASPGSAGHAGTTGSAGTSGGNSAGGGASGTGGGSSGGISDGGSGGSASAHYYVSPSGTGTACSSSMPCSITDAQSAVRAAAPSTQSDIVVELADGVYALKAPLVFSTADSGMNGHKINWQAAPSARPVLSGGQKITGWTISDATKNIWKATAPAAFATRQLFVDGKLATRARSEVNRSDLTFNDTGISFSNAALNGLSSVAHQDHVDFHAIGSFTDRYAPVQSIANNAAVMVQPAWANNVWGWDTIPSPFRASHTYFENAYEFIDQPGEWYLDTATATLYYEPLANQDMAKVDVELPQLQALLTVTGTYASPAHDLVFTGLTFSYTSWLNPNTTDGYANQQTGAFIHGSGYPIFEASRPKWWQMPAAIQVSAAKTISFVRDRFVGLGQVGLGIGNDDNAHLSAVGLGTDTISVTGCVFTQLAGGAIVLGGIQGNAHHPSNPAMVNQNSTISNNVIHDVGIDYRDAAGILFTYTTNVTVSHNELHDLPYSGICSGYGWGANDAGGSPEYEDRKLYDYQPKYTTPTTAKNNKITANLMKDVVQQMNDAGYHYNLSANPGTVVSENYFQGGGTSQGGYFASYEDEGSRYLTLSKNVFQSFGAWGTQNVNGGRNYTGDLTVTKNWLSGGSNIANGDRNDVVTGNITLNDGTLPADAQAIANAAGLEAAYADLKTQ
ncbi:MAG TPA: right-handed parallel beta-helix repeat-containing protein [Polyangiales bacterium]